ncbi:pleurocidin-like peptide WF3 [Chaetodon trifascialis]|uniref:pleurocidin-like peptide WF3 n=1 Tax=Chaetodon trifascialis TaxID=109706 RepID=UPI0039917869
MKCAVVFLVLFMVILMAQPGECIFGFLLNGAIHVGRLIHGLVTRRRGMEDEVQELDKRSFQYNPGQPGFH